MKKAPPPHIVIYDIERNSLVDVVMPGETPEKAIERLASFGTALVPMTYEEASRRMEDSHLSQPVEIDAEKWDYALNVLPPHDWQHTSNGESFKMIERLTGNITAIYVALNKRYFTFNDTIRLPHNECYRKVFESEAYKNPQEKERQ